MSNLFWFVLPAVTAGALAFALTPLTAWFARRVGAVDLPGERKVHSAPIPRLGGLAVVASVASVLTASFFFSARPWQIPVQLLPGFALGILPIIGVSLIDDVRGVGHGKKFLFHGLGAATAVALGVSLAPTVHLFGTPIHIGVLALPLSFLWIVGVTNAFNIIDGLDGLSAGLALISAASMSAVFMLVDQSGMAAVSLVLAGALAGFLPYNTHPAKIFLGDTGATAVGFSLAVFALKGGSTLSSGFAAALPILVLGLPIADTLIAIVRRALRRAEFKTGGLFEADSNHIHHRLMGLGIDHRKAVLILYLIGLILAAVALLSIFLKAREAALFVMAVLLAGMVGIHRLGYDEFAFIRRGKVLRIYDMSGVKRGMFVVFVDIAFAVIAAYLAAGLKYDIWRGHETARRVLDLATTFAPVTVAVFWWSGMYRGSWRVASMSDLTSVVTSVALAVPVAAFLLTLYSPTSYPISMFVIYGAISLIMTAGARASYVVLEDSQQRANKEGAPAVIYGAGRHGVAAARELFAHPASGLRPVGFIDDDEEKRGRIVSGLPVFGAVRELEAVLRTGRASALILASPLISKEGLRHAEAACAVAKAEIYRMDVRLERMSSESAPLVPAPRQIQVARRIDPSDDAESATSGRGTLCPSCHSSRVQRSKARTLFERLRRDHGESRLYRCQPCGWRGWLLPLDYLAPGEVQETGVPDLSSLDRALAADSEPCKVETSNG